MPHAKPIAICNGTVYVRGRPVSPGTVLVQDGRIVAVGPSEDVRLPRAAKIVDAEGLSVVPGLIDLHLHGLLGQDVMGTGLARVMAQLPAYGVTAFLATTVSMPQSETLDALATMARILDAPSPGARCLGIHLEGPFLARRRAGMAREEWLSAPDWETAERCFDAARNHVRMVTLAPELPGGLDFLSRCLRRGVVPSIGHSDASFDQVGLAVDRGLRHATHTFNAMRPLHHREPGVVGAVMVHEAIVAELIADGVHVHPAVVDLLLRVKGIERVALVSDASPLAGLPDGAYEWGGQTVRVGDGACRLADGTLAGAHTLLDTGLRTLVCELKYALGAALVSAATVPARVLGVRAGRLEPGCHADIVLLNESLRPARTLVGGVDVWAGAADSPAARGTWRG